MAVFNENHDYDKIWRVTKPVSLLQNLISNVGGMCRDEDPQQRRERGGVGIKRDKRSQALSRKETKNQSTTKRPPLTTELNTLHVIVTGEEKIPGGHDSRNMCLYFQATIARIPRTIGTAKTNMFV